MKVLPKYEFEVNFSVQSYASLPREDPAYLQITYHYLYFLKYAELKSFLGHQVWVPELVYRLLNPSGYVYASHAHSCLDLLLMPLVDMFRSRMKDQLML